MDGRRQPLTITIDRSGGFAGIRRTTAGVIEPGSAAHDAARRLMASEPAGADASPRPRPDGFSYHVSIATPDGVVAERRFGDPVPDDVAALLAALGAPD